MNKYDVRISSKAEKELDALPNEIVFKVYYTLKELSSNPKPYGYKKLKNRDGFRIRLGNYRIIYMINDSELIVLIVRIGHRKDIYK